MQEGLDTSKVSNHSRIVEDRTPVAGWNGASWWRTGGAKGLLLERLLFVKVTRNSFIGFVFSTLPFR